MWEIIWSEELKQKGTLLRNTWTANRRQGRRKELKVRIQQSGFCEQAQTEKIEFVWLRSLYDIFTTNIKSIGVVVVVKPTVYLNI